MVKIYKAKSPFEIASVIAQETEPTVIIAEYEYGYGEDYHTILSPATQWAVYMMAFEPSEIFGFTQSDTYGWFVGSESLASRNGSPVDEGVCLDAANLAEIIKCNRDEIILDYNPNYNSPAIEKMQKLWPEKEATPLCQIAFTDLNHFEGSPMSEEPKKLWNLAVPASNEEVKAASNKGFTIRPTKPMRFADSIPSVIAMVVKEVEPTIYLVAQKGHTMVSAETAETFPAFKAKTKKHLEQYGPRVVRLQMSADAAASHLQNWMTNEGDKWQEKYTKLQGEWLENYIKENTLTEKLRTVQGANFNIPAPKSQKVRGMAAVTDVLQIAGSAWSEFVVRDWYFGSASDFEDATESDLRAGHVLEWFKEGVLFLRPCPTRPRHGFVDSRVVTTIEEIQEIARASLDADPDAELLFTKFAKPNGNMILTESTLSWGKGHEGATSGKAQVLFGPEMTDRNRAERICRAATIADGDSFYVEMVDTVHPLTDQGAPGEPSRIFAPVQVRGGPPQQAATDYVPEEIRVNKVIVAHEDYDLQQWETDIAEAPQGTVVYAPGMALSNHFCVHAVVNKVPCVTTIKPEVGQRLAKIECPKWDTDDWKRLAAYMEEADAAVAADVNSSGWYNRMGDAARLGLAALHTAGTPTPATDTQLRFLASGAVVHAKMLAAACYGEMRHCTNASVESGSRVKPIQKAVRRLSDDGEMNDRTWCFRQAFAADTHALELSMYALSVSFREMDWRSSFGGYKWSKIAVAARRMLSALNRFRNKPTARNWALIVSPWNKAINEEHNGGDGALSKFGANKTLFDAAANWPLGFLSLVQPRYMSWVFEGIPKVPASVLRIRRTSLKIDDDEKVPEEKSVGLLLKRASSYLGEGNVRVVLSAGSEHQTVVKDASLSAALCALPVEFQCADGVLSNAHFGIGRLTETDQPPKGGKKFVRSIRAMEAILDANDCYGYEPVSFKTPYLHAIEIAATGMKFVLRDRVVMKG